MTRQGDAGRRATRGVSSAADLGAVGILLTDVEPAIRLNAELEAAGVSTALVSPLDDVRKALRKADARLVVMTGALLDGNNVALVREQLWRGATVIGFTDAVDDAMLARLQAVGYAELFPKPVSIDEVTDAVKRRLERSHLAELTGLVGESDPIREVLVKVEQIAPVSSTVLIEGESGTGKELVARAIHQLSPRRTRPFIAVNVGALPDTLLESELFGHEKGSFTGASERRLGRFELADTGTLFLDEIGDIPASTQVKLLRVLEDRTVTRVGGGQTIPVDVRVVAATNRSLREQVDNGTFRADLYYRLNVLRVYLPPLRERPGDIALLVRRFIGEFSAQHDRPFHGLSAEALALLVSYPWPGNVRELRNLVESMVVLAPGHEIGPDDIPRAIREGGGRRLLPVPVGPLVREGERAQGRELEFIVRSLVELKLQVEDLRRRLDADERELASPWVGEVRGVSSLVDGPLAPPAAVAPAWDVRAVGGGIAPREVAPPPTVFEIGPGMTMAEIERRAIEGALQATGGNRRKAADLLGIGERTLYRKLKEYHGDALEPEEHSG